MLETPLVGAGQTKPPSPEVVCTTAHRLRLERIWGRDVFSPSKFPLISTAYCSDDLLRIGRVRYELFVERDGKNYPADHERRLLIEDIDALSLNIEARDGDRSLTGLRLTRGQDAIADRQLRAILLNSECARPPYSDCLLLSRFTVQRELRARMQILDLLRHTYVVGLMQGARYALLATRPSLIHMFERFGFNATARRLVDPIAGELEVLTLEIRDRERLRTTSSPLLGELDHFLLIHDL